MTAEAVIVWAETGMAEAGMALTAREVIDPGRYWRGSGGRGRDGLDGEGRGRDWRGRGMVGGA